MLAGRHRRRGADAVYVAVALRYSAVLVTLDRQQQELSDDVVTVRTPADVLAGRPSS